MDIRISVEQEYKPVFIYLCVNVKLAQAVRTAKIILLFNCSWEAMQDFLSILDKLEKEVSVVNS